jgi:hypothetical protein
VNQDVYVLAEGPGLYRSSNAGLNWQYLSNSFWLALLLDPEHHTRLYGGGHINNGGGAFLSTNSGLNFEPIGLSGLQVNGLAINGSGRTLYAAVHGVGILVSSVVGLPPLARRPGQITSQ